MQSRLDLLHLLVQLSQARPKGITSPYSLVKPRRPLICASQNFINWARIRCNASTVCCIAVQIALASAASFLLPPTNGLTLRLPVKILFSTLATRYRRHRTVLYPPSLPDAAGRPTKVGGVHTISAHRRSHLPRTYGSDHHNAAPARADSCELCHRSSLSPGHR